MEVIMAIVSFKNYDTRINEASLGQCMQSFSFNSCAAGTVFWQLWSDRSPFSILGGKRLIGVC